MNIKNKLRQLKRNLRLHRQLLLSKNAPIIVYQMGKVGSSSIYSAIEQAAIQPVFHIHRMNPVNIQEVRKEHTNKGVPPLDESIGGFLYRHIAQRQRKATFITLVRSPIWRNISAFFQNFGTFAGDSFKIEQNYNIPHLIDKFIQEYNHLVPLTWFDKEMKQTLGIDVYEYPFPKEEGTFIIRKGNFDLLILKCEIDDRAKTKSISEFLGLNGLNLVRTNVGQNKDYAKVYQDFVATIKLPKAYIETMCDSKYTKHFYNETEIDRMRSRWSEA